MLVFDAAMSPPPSPSSRIWSWAEASAALGAVFPVRVEGERLEVEVMAAVEQRTVVVRERQAFASAWLELVVDVGMAALESQALPAGLTVGAFAQQGDRLVLRQLLPLAGLPVRHLIEAANVLGRLAADQLRLRARAPAAPPPESKLGLEILPCVAPELCAAVVAQYDPQFTPDNRHYQHHDSVEVLMDPFSDETGPAAELIASVRRVVADYASRAGLALAIQGGIQHRLARYRPGMHCPRHHDFFGNGVQPTVSSVMPLGAGYTGGQLVFDRGGVDQVVDQPVGSLLLFPSTIDFPHRVEPVTSGVRHVLLYWF